MSNRKIILDLDESGNVYSPSGLLLYAGLSPTDHFGVKTKPLTTEEITELMGSGLSADDILKLRKKGVL